VADAPDDVSRSGRPSARRDSPFPQERLVKFCTKRFRGNQFADAQQCRAQPSGKSTEPAGAPAANSSAQLTIAAEIQVSA